jgi:hypothetical protein
MKESSYYQVAVRIYNRLPNKLKVISNTTKFKVSLKAFLYLNSFIHWMNFLRDDDCIFIQIKKKLTNVFIYIGSNDNCDYYLYCHLLELC